MKKLLLIFLLSSFYCFGQSKWTLYDCVTLVPGNVVWVEPTDPSVCYTTDYLRDNKWFKPRYDATCNCFVNTATAAEQYVWSISIEAYISTDINFAINEAVILPLTDDELNFYYSPLLTDGFRLLCPNLEFPGFANSMMIYVRYKNGKWGRNMMLKNIN